MKLTLTLIRLLAYVFCLVSAENQTTHRMLKNIIELDELPEAVRRFSEFWLDHHQKNINETRQRARLAQVKFDILNALNISEPPTIWQRNHDAVATVRHFRKEWTNTSRSGRSRYLQKEEYITAENTSTTTKNRVYLFNVTPMKKMAYFHYYLDPKRHPKRFTVKIAQDDWNIGNTEVFLSGSLAEWRYVHLEREIIKPNKLVEITFWNENGDLIDMSFDKSHQPMIRTEVDGKRRKRRHTQRRRHNGSHRSGMRASCNNSKKCCLRDSIIPLSELEWAKDWIIAPTTFNARMCEGDCRITPTAPRDPHSHLKEQMAFDTCCHPDQYDELKIMFFSDENAILIQDLEKMIALGCKCG